MGLLATIVMATLLGMFGAVMAQAADPSPDNLVLSCSGPFAKESGAADLAAVFGAVNVREEEVGGAEGESVKATVLYPDDPKRRLEIAWWDEAARRRPSSVRAREEGSLWRVGGVGIGSDLDAAVAANAAPLTISGFGWDYGGMVTDWNAGRLPKTAGAGCVVQMGFSTEAAGPDRIMGDGVVLRSDDRDIKAARPTVIDIGIGWPEN
jgi:hypothetical protein